MNETLEEKIEAVSAPQVPQNEVFVADAEVIQTPQIVENEKSVVQSEDLSVDSTNSLTGLVETQASQYQYIESLENRIFADNAVDENELNDAAFCKSQVLLQLVCVESFAAGLQTDDPRRTVVDTLLSHLYKCYDKTEKVRSKAAAEKFQTDYQKQIGAERVKERHERNIMADDYLMPRNNHISLMIPGMSIASIGLLKELVENPQERVKAQLPDLIEELGVKMTPDQKEFANLWTGKLVDELGKFKGAKAMMNALEGNNIMTALKQLAGGKGGNAA